MSTEALQSPKTLSSISHIETKSTLSETLSPEQTALHASAKKIEETVEISDEAIQAAVLAATPIPPAKITTFTEESSEIAKIASTAEVSGNPLPIGDVLFSADKPKPTAKEVLKNSPNVGFELLMLGLGKLDQLEGDLEGISAKMEEVEKKLEAVAHLTGKIAALPADQKKYTLTDDLKKNLSDLKELGVDILTIEGDELSAEKLSALKTQLDSLKGQLQSRLQKEMINMQPKTQQYNSMIDILKRLIDLLTRLYSAINQKMGTR